MYNKLCVAVDGSESSLNAVKTAARLAASLDAEMVVFHVIRNMKVPNELKRFVKKAALEKVRQDALEEVGKEIVDHALAVVAQQGIARCSADILQGDPARSIVAGANKHRCDLIVVGTRGLGQMEGILMGSISRKITDISDISVLVVK